MEQKVIRSRQNGATNDVNTINTYLAGGWVIVSSQALPGHNNIYGYIEYVLEYKPNTGGVMEYENVGGGV